MHDHIDNIENRLRSEFSCVATIHMDPIAVDDGLISETRAKGVRP